MDCFPTGARSRILGFDAPPGGCGGWGGWNCGGWNCDGSTEAAGWTCGLLPAGRQEESGSTGPGESIGAGAAPGGHSGKIKGARSVGTGPDAGGGNVGTVSVGSGGPGIVVG